MYTFKNRLAHFTLFWHSHTLGQPATGSASLSKPLPHRCRPHVGSTNGIDSVNQSDHSGFIQDIQPPPTLPSYFCRPRLFFKKSFIYTGEYRIGVDTVFHLTPVSGLLIYEHLSTCG